MSEENKKWKKISYSFKSEDQILNFGQFEGKSIGEIMKSYPEYIDWCIKNFKGFKLCKKLAIRFHEIKEEAKNKKN
ncbi:MAG: hypothetical protein HPY57_15085 [Ignavibacteria bacterium]|nr:hypothetical protein [Ignavibacteria bacterium]